MGTALLRAHCRFSAGAALLALTRSAPPLQSPLLGEHHFAKALLPRLCAIILSSPKATRHLLTKWWSDCPGPLLEARVVRPMQVRGRAGGLAGWPCHLAGPGWAAAARGLAWQGAGPDGAAAAAAAAALPGHLATSPGWHHPAVLGPHRKRNRTTAPHSRPQPPTASHSPPQPSPCPSPPARRPT
jgi:hypothetical protein